VSAAKNAVVFNFPNGVALFAQGKIAMGEPIVYTQHMCHVSAGIPEMFQNIPFHLYDTKTAPVCLFCYNNMSWKILLPGYRRTMI
jgi:hypothetical protein